MYVIRNKKTKAILHMAPSVPGEEDRTPEELYPDFDSRTMEFGKSDEPRIPAWFTIEKGKVKAAEPPAPPAAAAVQAEPPPLEEIRALAIAHFSRQSMEERQELVPDYQMMNAGLGLYDEERTESIRATVAAFRDEYYRLVAALKAAKSVEDLKELKPNFPSAMLPGGSTPQT